MAANGRVLVSKDRCRLSGMGKGYKKRNDQKHSSQGIQWRVDKLDGCSGKRMAGKEENSRQE